MKGRGLHPQKVFVHNYPFEASANSLAFVMRRYSEVNDISYRCCLHMNKIYRLIALMAAKKYSFFFMLIRLTSLVGTDKIQKKRSFVMRLVGLISTKTKECFFGRHLCNRSMAVFVL